MLMAQWKKIKRKSQFTRAPALLHRETGLTRGLVRDLFSAKVDSLRSTRSRSSMKSSSISRLWRLISSDRVKLYEERIPLFDTAGIEAGDPGRVQAPLRPAVRRLHHHRAD